MTTFYGFNTTYYYGVNIHGLWGVHSGLRGSPSYSFWMIPNYDYSGCYP